MTTPVSRDYYNYTAGAGTDATTGLVSAMSHNAVNGSSLSYMYLSYQYDALGNVTQETQTGLGTTSYTYDAQSQLTQASRGSGSYIWNYSYDTYGNLRSWEYRVADLAQESAEYSYGNTDWLDLLTGVKLKNDTVVQPIVYEGQSLSGSTVSGTPTSGNPVSWYDGTRWTLTWRNGRELATASKSGVSLSFEYDANGLRTGKTRSATNKHAYVYAGGKILRDKYTYAASYIYYMDFVYDASGRPYALYLTVDGQSSVYYYLLNAQGDVVRLVGADGATVANYTYDPYGRLLGVTNASGAAITSGTHVANLNPLRYRGYYYDTETGWYYLQSRYYDPIIKRFLNADGYASTGQGFLGYNMFAYCGNNPVNAYDPSGSRSIIEEQLGGGVIGTTDTGTGLKHKGQLKLINEEYCIDMTEDFEEYMFNASRVFREYIESHNYWESVLFFYDHVNHGAEWDLKRKPEWKQADGITYVYRGITLRNDDLGNILYGYVGSNLFQEVILYLGAGYANGFEGPCYGDDPHDIKMIRLGIALHELYGK